MQAFYFGVKLTSSSRHELFQLLNQEPTLFDIVAERRPSSMFTGRALGKRPRMVRVGSAHRKLEWQCANCARQASINSAAESDGGHTAHCIQAANHGAHTTQGARALLHLIQLGLMLS